MCWRNKSRNDPLWRSQICEQPITRFLFRLISPSNELLNGPNPQLIWSKIFPTTLYIIDMISSSFEPLIIWFTFYFPIIGIFNTIKSDSFYLICIWILKDFDDFSNWCKKDILLISTYTHYILRATNFWTSQILEKVKQLD